MASARAAVMVKELPKGLKPLLSNNTDDARRRVMALYRAWMRQATVIAKSKKLPLTEKMMKDKVRADFAVFQEVTDLRVLDAMVAKSALELQEAHESWMQTTHLLRSFNPTIAPKKTDFMSRFYNKNR